jgi:spermidine/putrescine transport system permease protein
MPVIMLIVLARLQRLDPSLEQASMDLGANRWRTFAHVTLPLIRSALIGGALLGFTLSLDEVIVTLFLTGVEPTLPVYVWNQMRFGFTPTVNAIFTCIGVFSLMMILVATRLLRTDPGHGGSGSITGITG